MTEDFNKASRVVLLKPYLFPNCELSFRFEVSHSFGNELITRKSCLVLNVKIKGLCFLISAVC